MLRARILVVEDERLVAHDLATMLEDLGYSVVGTASGGTEAIEKALDLAPDLIIMDIRLDGRPDGIEAARTVRERAGIPVVFLTAYADDITLERAKAAAPYGYVVKPFAERELHSTIQVALQRVRVEGGTAGGHLASAAIIDDLGGGYYALDREWRFTRVSRAAEVLLGDTEAALVGRGIWEEFPEFEDSELRDVYHRVATQRTSAVLETFHLPGRLFVRLRIEPTEDGILVYFVART